MKKLFFIGLAFLNTLALGESFKLEDPARLIEVIDVVDGTMIPEVAQKIDSLSTSSSNPITLLINSPGGNVMVGTTILDSMRLAKSRGVTFKCISGVIAASMAFVILAHCDERYALTGTKLLFHPVSTNGAGRLQELLISMEQVKDEEEDIMSFLKEKMGLPWKKFRMHYFAETMWSGQGLAKHTGGDGKFITVVTSVKGFKNLLVTEKPKSGFFLQRFKADYLKANKILERAGLFVGGGTPSYPTPKTIELPTTTVNPILVPEGK